MVDFDKLLKETKDKCPRCRRRDMIRRSANGETCICDNCNYGMVLAELVSTKDLEEL